MHVERLFVFRMCAWPKDPAHQRRANSERVRDTARAREARVACRAARQECGKECWRCGLAWLNTSATDARASRMRKYRISGGGLYQVTRYQPDYQPDGVSTLVGG